MKRKLLLPRKKQLQSQRKEHQAYQEVMTMPVITKFPVTVEVATMSLMSLSKLTKGKVVVPKRQSTAVMMKAVERNGEDPRRARVKVEGRRKAQTAMTVITKGKA